MKPVVTAGTAVEAPAFPPEKVMKRIISASRRTDIPAFYGDWFMSRIDEGAAGIVNPFGGTKSTVSLSSRDVSLFVFWSKDYKPFIDSLERLGEKGYRFYMHYTITGLPPVFEGNVPAWRDAADTARRLSDTYSPVRVVWRFDPVIFSSATPPEMILETFSLIAGSLAGYVERCVFSFVDYYGKVLRSFSRLHVEKGIVFHLDEVESEKLPARKVPSPDTFIENHDRSWKIEFAKKLSRIAGDNGISLHACCEDFTLSDTPPVIHKARCIDPDLVEKIAGAPSGAAARPTRPECGCFESTDIGAYDTCPHGCTYCYANANRKAAMKKYNDLKNEHGVFALKPGAARQDFPDAAGRPEQADFGLK